MSELVILGPPGSGKGTQAKPLAERLHARYVSTGQAAAQRRRRGQAVHGARRARAGRARGRRSCATPSADGGYVLDGFPRNVAQAEALDAVAQPRAVAIEVPDQSLVARLAGRRVCEANGHEYHVEFKPPKQPGVCDVDGSKLIRRADDEPETIQRRLAVYHEQTEPLLAYYEQRGRLTRVDGDGDPDTVARRLSEAVE